jgi:O-antigen ligase
LPAHDQGCARSIIGKEMIAAPIEGIRKEASSAEQWLFWCFAGLFLTVPMGTSPPLVCGVLAAMIWVFSGLVSQVKSFVKQSWSWPILFMIALAWIGMIYTPDPWGFGIQYAGKTYFWIFCFAAASLQPFRTHWLINAFLLGLAINACVGILQFSGVLVAKHGWFSGLERGYNTVSVNLVLGILLVSFYFREARERIKRVALVLLMAFYFFHLIILEGRAGYLTFIVLLPLMAKTLFKRLGMIKIVSALLIIIGLMLLSPIVRERLDLTVRQLKYHMETEPGKAWGREYTENQDRFFMWYNALQIIVENPILGVGTGGYPTVVKKRAKVDDPLVAHPHNNLLHMVVSHGLFGAAAFLWFFVEVLRNASSQRDKALGHLILCTALVILVNGLFNTTILDAGTLLLLSPVVGLQRGLPKFAQGQPGE